MLDYLIAALNAGAWTFEVFGWHERCGELRLEGGLKPPLFCRDWVRWAGEVIGSEHKTMQGERHREGTVEIIQIEDAGMYGAVPASCGGFVSCQFGREGGHGQSEGDGMSEDEVIQQGSKQHWSAAWE